MTNERMDDLKIEVEWFIKDKYGFETEEARNGGKIGDKPTSRSKG